MLSLLWLRSTDLSRRAVLKSDQRGNPSAIARVATSSALVPYRASNPAGVVFQAG
jgi:hypothetical protein